MSSMRGMGEGTGMGRGEWGVKSVECGVWSEAVRR
jgi:hypothetical protein